MKCFDLEFAYTSSSRGKPVLLLGRHRYNKHSSSRGPVNLWICSKWFRENCRASIKTYNNEIIKRKLIHNHY